MTDTTTPRPRLSLTRDERDALEAAARSTNLWVSDLQMVAIDTEVERILAARLAATGTGLADLQELSDRAASGVWRQEFYLDGELLPDGTGGMDDHETAGSTVYVIDETSDEGFCLNEFDAGTPADAAFIVAAVNYLRENFLGSLGSTGEDEPR